MGIPRNGIKALNAVHESGGYMIDVTDEEILAAMKLLARRDGYLRRAGRRDGLCRNPEDAREKICLPETKRSRASSAAAGLKDIKSAAKAAGTAHTIEPSLAEVSRIVGK